MKTIINNKEFNYDLGCRILKLKYKEPFEGLEDIWDHIEPLSFEEICELPNIEERRVAIDCFGLEKLHKELNSKLIDEKIIKKKTTWVLENGTLETKEYDDIYKLYEVDGNIFSNKFDNKWNRFNNQQYLMCNDTSTDRVYLIWIDNSSVYRTNNSKELWLSNSQMYPITAIQAIAWTITTDVPKDCIKEIIRQGDCILIKPKEDYKKLRTFRHLTEEEYLTLLTNES